MTTDQKIARQKLSLLDLAADLGKVSRACEVMGYSREQFYEIRRNFRAYGADGLLDRSARRVAAPRPVTKHERLLRLERATAERTLTLTGDQVKLPERFSPEFRERHIEAPHTGVLVAVDTFFLGVLKGAATSASRPCSMPTWQAPTPSVPKPGQKKTKTDLKTAA